MRKLGLERLHDIGSGFYGYKGKDRIQTGVWIPRIHIKFLQKSSVVADLQSFCFVDNEVKWKAFKSNKKDILLGWYVW